jgi:ferredoxin
MKIILKKKQCIGCGSCVAVCPDFFEVADDGLSDLKRSQFEGDNQALEVNELGCAKEAAEVCPVQVIEIVS